MEAFPTTTIMNNMEFVLSTARLKQVAPLLRILVDRVQVIPAYKMVLMQPEEKGVWLTTGNMESQLSCFVAGDIIREGGNGLVSKTFFNFCQNCHAEKISFRFSEGDVHLECGNYKNILRTLPSEQFPLLPEETAGFTVQLKVKQLKDALLATQRSMAINDVRPYLNGMAFVFKDDSLQCVSSDGHRLATSKFSTGNGKDGDHGQPVLLRKTVQVLDKILPGNEENEETVEVTVFESQVIFRSKTMVYKVKPIEDQYPDFSRTYPGQALNTAFLDRDDFIVALRQAVAIYDGNEPPVAEFSFGGEELKVVSRNSESEQTDVSLSARLEGDSRVIWFNIQYLLDALESLSTEEVKVEIDERGGMLMTGVSEDGYPKHVIMSLNR